MTAKKKGPVTGINHTGVCVAYLMFDAEGRLAIHKRGPACRDEQGLWDYGSGKCEFGEDPAAAVPREILQEYGLTVRAQDVHFVATRNVLRDLKVKTGKNTAVVPTHWICLVYAVLLDDVQPKLEPQPAEANHVLHPAWLFPENLKFLPRHSQADDHVSLVLKWKLGKFGPPSPAYGDALSKECGEMFGRLASIPGAALYVDQAVIAMATSQKSQAAPDPAIPDPAIPA